MCQGVIVSLVKFGKKRVVLSGVGSHSDLLQANLEKLKKLGWVAGSSSESVVSIESDFSGWNKFTVESGVPTKSELAILKREYKRIAGNARALIAHVKRLGKIDGALVDLLTAAAKAEYNKVTAAARAEYNKVTAAAWAEYNKVTAAARAEYDKVTAPAWIKLFSEKSNRVKRLQ